ncbi:CRISPR-associated RAMP protein, Cmr4 family [Acidilobus saccharovorans 345-15]|uniref:CRISPR-associated RAMP protein, Cmr4 family n=1 Tax=Acidilobus saccharovorans (strain DSM 16705 / JCM 18335 / VKM B-2471 / 345-15) TaxID=666510 RepID=D9PZD4_ACIS3|nr:CRISPR-associated RAMP protein, Cmr4 family [Acidilobus saccharovorans 345-15]
MVLAYAVTPVHVGSGRSPGFVDLPFQRDSMGYPVILGSSFKGALRFHLTPPSSGKPNDKGGGNDKDNKLVRCAFGPDIDEGGAKFMGRLVFTDLVPFLYPAPSLSEGYIYVTTKYLLNRAYDILSTVGVSPPKALGAGGTVTVGLREVRYAYTVNVSDVLGGRVDTRSLGYLLKDKAYVFDDDVGLQVVESSLVRVTRNALDDKTKTVKERALWTEEYVPQGTVMVGAMLDSMRGSVDSMGGNDECRDIDVMTELSNKLNRASLFIGGKETVGKGLVRLLIVSGTGAVSGAVR